MKFVIEFNEGAREFRIVAPDGKKGPWALYTGVASMIHNGKIYAAVTSYYDGSYMRPETVFALTAKWTAVKA